MTKLKYYDIAVSGRRQAVYLKGDVDEYIADLKRKIERQFLFNDVFMERFHIFTRHKRGCTWDDSEKGDVCTCGLQALITMYYELVDTQES